MSSYGGDPKGRGRRESQRGRPLLIVDADRSHRGRLARITRERGFDPLGVADGRRLMDLVEGGIRPEMVLLDLDTPGLDGLETLSQLRTLSPDIQVLVLSSLDEAATVVEAMRLGACGFLIKPVSEADLERIFDEAVGPSPADDAAADVRSTVLTGRAMGEIREAVDRIAETDVGLLIRGETGVGKEVVAREVHARSARAAKPFVKVHCAALPSQLLESELFGFERGAFTGANESKPGRFETADGGTLLLDEIGDMSAGLQAKLLQALQDRSFTRIGGNEERQVDVRVICATHRPLEQMIEEGTFREDLFFRINVFELTIPPLRARRDEIATLFETFLRDSSRALGKPAPPVSKRVHEELQRYAFPGNVRELRNMARRVVALQDGECLLRELKQRGPSAEAADAAMKKLIDELEETAGYVPLLEVRRRAATEAEYHLLEHVLVATNWNRRKAARWLNVSYSTLLQKIRACGLLAPGAEGSQRLAPGAENAGNPTH